MPRYRRVLGPLAACLMTAVVCAPIAGAQASRDVGSIPSPTDQVEECNNALTPESATVWTGTGTDVRLSVLVLLDQVARPDAEAIVTKAAAGYRQLRIIIEPTYEKATFDPAVTRAEELIAAARGLYGGARPPGSDAVFILTNRDVSIATGDAVGYADCIGGIRYPNRAFAVGEASDEPLTTASLNFYVNGPAKIMAHEIGHLLGARHQDANCVEGIEASDVSGREPTPCTMMTNYLDLQSNKFGTWESFIVRYYAEKYAAP